MEKFDFNNCSIQDCLKHDGKQKHKTTARIFFGVLKGLEVKAKYEAGDVLFRDINLESKLTEGPMPSGKQIRPYQKCDLSMICFPNGKLQMFYLTNEEVRAEIRKNPSLTHLSLDSKDPEYIDKMLGDHKNLWSLSRSAKNLHEWDKYLIDVGDILAQKPSDVTDEDRTLVYEKIKARRNGYTLSKDECAKLLGASEDMMDNIG